MGRLRNVAVSHEIRNCLSNIGKIAKTVYWHRLGPLVSVAFAVDVQMRNGYFRAVRVTVWRAAEIKPHQHDDLTASVLQFDLAQINAALTQIKEELLPAISRLKRQGDRSPWSREVVELLVDAMLFHGYQGIGLSLGQVGLGHQTSCLTSYFASWMRSFTGADLNASISRRVARLAVDLLRPARLYRITRDCRSSGDGLD